MLWAPHLGKKKVSIRVWGIFAESECLRLEWTCGSHLAQPSCSHGTTWSQLPKTVSRQLLNISKNEYFWVSRSAPPIPLWICYWRSRWYTNMHNTSLKTCKWNQELWFEPHPSEHYFAVVYNQPKSHLCLSSPAFKKKSDFLLTQLRELAPCQVTETPAWARRRDWNCMTRGEMRSRQDYCSLCLSMT